MTLPPRLVVFDLDGTLIDSRRDLALSANEMLASYGAAPLSVGAVAGMVGDGARVLVDRALRAATLDPAEPDALARFLAIYDRRLLDFTRPYDGVLDVLRDAAAQSTIAVLTNKPEAPARRLLEAFGFTPLVRWVVGGDSGYPRKPDPAGLTSLIARAETTPARTMMVGDSPIDGETARRAGATFCAALYGFSGVTGGDYAAASSAELAAAIRAFTMRSQEGRLLP